MESERGGVAFRCAGAFSSFLGGGDLSVYPMAVVAQLMPKSRLAWSCWNYITSSVVDAHGKRKPNADQVSLCVLLSPLRSRPSHPISFSPTVTEHVSNYPPRSFHPLISFISISCRWDERPPTHLRN